jgi:signal transduction histidine kinase
MRITLRPKIMLGVLGPLAIVLALFAYIQYKVQRSLLLDTTVRTATDISDVIEGSLQYAMLARNRAEIQIAIDDIAANSQVVNLLLLNHASQVRASFPQEMLGRRFRKSDVGCVECHGPGAPYSGEFSAIVVLPDRSRVLRSFNLIENKQACHRCHDSDQPYNGVLITDLSLTEVERQATRHLQQILLLLASGLLFGAIMLGVTMERSVLQPLSQFRWAIRDFDRGDLRRRVQVSAHDGEIGELARTFNHMADGVEDKLRLEGQLQQHAKDLQRLNSQLREKEAMRAQLLKRAISAQEEERARLSRELHDEIGQMLTAVQLGLDRLARVLPSDDQAPHERLERVRMLTDQTLADVRRVITALRPGVLDQLGLVTALNWVAEHTLQPLGIQITLETTGFSDRLPTELEITLFRIAQEAMSNVARHSKASHVVIQLAQVSGQVKMTLADDGVGFTAAEPTSPPEQSRGLGLAGMQERASLVGGWITVDSIPGHGTTIQVIVPMSPLSRLEGEKEDQTI